jgi:quercetin dioxygenase-like cupin family protein
MSDFADDLFLGHLSRRSFLERLSAAGGGLSVLAGAFPGEVAECQEVPRKPAADEDEVRYSPDNIGGGGRIERNFYREWLKKSKVPRVDVYNVKDARTQEVLPWPETGGRGMYVNFAGNVHMDTVLLEIPEGGALVPRRHAYEQLIHVLSGHGHTVVGEGGGKQSVAWGEGALFTVPLNAVHRHHNDDAAHPARLMLVTTFPFMMQVFGSLGMVEELGHDFRERFAGQPDYYSRAEQIHKRWWRLNLVKDIRSADVIPWEERGKGNASLFWDMGGNTILEPHVSQFPVHTYKLGHRHPYEAIILTLNGKGFSIAGRDGLAERDRPVKIDWQEGSIVSPPYFWYHQHFNTGDTKARYWAITEGDFPKRLGIPLEVEQIEKEREDPGIRQLFEQELGRVRTSDAVTNPGLHHERLHAHGIPHGHGHTHGNGEG